MSLNTSNPLLEKSQTKLLSKFALENILHLIPTAVYCCDLEGNILYYNEKAAQLWGRRPNSGEVIEKFCGSYKIYTLDGSFLPNDQCPMAKAILGRLASLNGDIIIERPDRSWVYVTAHISAIRDEKGEIIGAINSLVDVSAEKALSQAYQTTLDNFRSLADFIPQLVWMANPAGEIDYYNQNFLIYSSLSKDEIKEGGWFQLIHPQDLSCTQQSWKQAVASLETFTATLRLKRGNDHAYRWFLVRAFPMKNEQGEIIRWFGTCTDVHEQKESEEELRRSQINLKDFLENANIGLHWVNAEGIIIWANKAEYELLGYSKDEYIGMPIAQVHADGRVIEDILNRLARRELLENYEASLRCKDGTIKQVLINSSVLWEGNKFIHTRCFTRDVTEQKKAEKELHEKNDNLERANKELLNINNHLDTFIYTASHDLKAPISNIEGLITNLSKYINEEVIDTEKVNKTLNYINGSICKFKTTLQDLTQITKLEKELENPTDIESVEVEELINEITEEMADVISDTQAIIELDCKQYPSLCFSRASMKSVLYNLLSNAIKYRHLRRKPHIQIKTEKKAEEMLLTVSDNGLGFDASKKEKVFILFKRLHTHVEGSGMGLYIVKRIIENFNGRIEVESQEGVGSSFRIVLQK